jgi:hypothetical protein
MHSCQTCNYEKNQLAPRGTKSDTAPIVSATQFHLDSGFIQTSSNDFGVTKGLRGVTSYDVNNTYLLIADAKQRYSWVFYQPSKSPPVSILKRFLAVHCLKDGPRFLCMDQSGKLWGSAQLLDIVNAVVYIIEPIGSNLEWDNGKVESLHGTFGVMVRCLLYIASLSAKSGPRQMSPVKCWPVRKILFRCAHTYSLSEEHNVSQGHWNDALQRLDRHQARD